MAEWNPEPATVPLIEALIGFRLPWEKMRQSRNVEEFLTQPVGKPLDPTDPADPLAVAAGLSDIGNPFVKLPGRKVKGK